LSISWPYSSTLMRLALALALGLLVGLERERWRKEAGVRTFGFASLLGALGSLLGEAYALLTMGLLGVLVVFLNVEKLRKGESPELTTSAALFLTGFAGVMCGQGHTLTPTAVAVITAAFLEWKQPLSGFSLGLSGAEVRSAILLAILAFVIYPALPEGSIDPWGAIDLRQAWITVILIAAIGFVNYVLWKLYSARGVELAGFLGGLVNSSVTVSELSSRVEETGGHLTDVAYRGILLATAAMLLRNAALLAILARHVLAAAVLPLSMMLAACGVFTLAHSKTKPVETEGPALGLQSPFSLKSALRFGLLFLALQVAGVLAQRGLGRIGVYAVSVIGGLFSSASAVAAAAALFSKGTTPAAVAGAGAVLASLASVAVNLPLVFRARDRHLTIRLAWILSVIAALGVAGAIIQPYALALLMRL
jgi:uncharacterized membrane protein (DUF4010 family)